MVNLKCGLGFHEIYNVITPLFFWKSQLSEMFVKIWAWPGPQLARGEAVLQERCWPKQPKTFCVGVPQVRQVPYIKFVKFISSLHSKIHKISNIRYIHQEKKYEKETCEVHSVWIWSGLTGVQPSSDQRKNKNRKLCHAMSKCLLKMCSNAIHCCTCKVTNPASGRFM